jgi:hypothetical protein
MCHSFLNDANFYQHLLRLDEALAAEVQAQGCPYCGGVLQSARYQRKPRGVNRHLLGPDYEYRLSFCCAAEGCRRRTTPSSVRFLGRRVYLGVVVVLITVLASGVSVKRAAWLSEQLGVGERTLQSWRRWWRKEFERSVFWRDAKAQLVPPVAVSSLPAALLARFSAETLTGQLTQLLAFIAPVSTAAGAAPAGHTG